MLPRQLSEGLISLNPDGPRRALVFWHRLDANGSLVDTRLQRAKIRSQAKLSFDEVQAFVDSPAGSPIQTRAYAASLLLLRDVGRLRMKLAAHRGLVRYRRDEVSIVLDGEGLAFTVVEALRDEVESWNEQLSLLCNAEGGRFLRESRDPLIQPIYRVQDGPEPARLASLARLTGHVARLNRLPARPWEWNPEISSLAEYLSGLPAGPAGSPSERLARALTRQAVMVNLRSAYSIEPGPHAGVGAEPYARFSAPMREIVGVFLHKEAIELLTGERSEPAAEDEKLQEKIVQVANRARQTQKQVRDLTFEAVLNRLFGPELSRDPPARTRFTGTVMGIAQAKLHVRLDSPPMDVKLYFPDLARNFSGGALEPGEEGAVLRVKGSTEPLLLLGQAITLAVRDYDSAKRHWCFRLWTTAGQDL
jgi:ribonuclease R